ncbi:MAG: hypothetical protein CM1200mP14_14640 [Gammaproteobacteria bacterium]|nr:MAG: hypothetical protein CM1200mP14_14640 [Gammaproteobacteria bacterium]
MIADHPGEISAIYARKNFAGAICGRGFDSPRLHFNLLTKPPALISYGGPGLRALKVVIFALTFSPIMTLDLVTKRWALEALSYRVANYWRTDPAYPGFQ